MPYKNTSLLFFIVGFYTKQFPDHKIVQYILKNLDREGNMNFRPLFKHDYQ